MMIPARKQPLFNFFLRRWVALTLRRRFHAVRIAGAEHLRTLKSTGRGARPVVGCVNHTNWWDGFVLYVLSARRVPHEIYLAMEAKNLRRYRFFTWMGVFGVDLADRRAAFAGVRYAVRLLRENLNGGRRKLVWMFVQGELLGPRLPVRARPGAGLLARSADADLLPVALRYEWLQESRPSIFIRIGKPLAPGSSPEMVSDALNDLLAQTDAEMAVQDFREWQELLRPSLSINKAWDYCIHRLKGGRRETFERENG